MSPGASIGTTAIPRQSPHRIGQRREAERLARRNGPRGAVPEATGRRSRRCAARNGARQAPGVKLGRRLRRPAGVTPRGRPCKSARRGRGRRADEMTRGHLPTRARPCWRMAPRVGPARRRCGGRGRRCRGGRGDHGATAGRVPPWWRARALARLASWLAPGRARARRAERGAPAPGAESDPRALYAPSTIR